MVAYGSWPMASCSGPFHLCFYNSFPPGDPIPSEECPVCLAQAKSAFPKWQSNLLVDRAPIRIAAYGWAFALPHCFHTNRL
jgi:hypothetical protein